MKRLIAVWASVQYAVHVDGAIIHVTGLDERQVEFGDGTTSFATLSGGEGYINSTVNVYGPDFVTMTGTSVNEMMTLIRDQQATILSQQTRIEALEQVVGMSPAAGLPPPVNVTCQICFDNEMTGLYLDGSAIQASTYSYQHTIQFFSNASVLALSGWDVEAGCAGGGFAISCESADPRWNWDTNNRTRWSVYTTTVRGRDTPTQPPPIVDDKDWLAIDYSSTDFIAGTAYVGANGRFENGWGYNGCPLVPPHLMKSCGGDGFTANGFRYWFVRYVASQAGDTN